MSRLRLADFRFSTSGPVGAGGNVVHLLHVLSGALPDGYRNPDNWNTLHAESFDALDFVRLGSVTLDASGAGKIWYDIAGVKGGAANLLFYLTEDCLDAAGRSIVRFLSPEIRKRCAPMEHFRVKLNVAGFRNSALPPSVSTDFPEGPGVVLARAAERLPEKLRRAAMPAEARALSRQRAALQTELGDLKRATLRTAFKIVQQGDAAPISTESVRKMATSTMITRASGASDGAMRLNVGADGDGRLVLPRVPDRLALRDEAQD